MNNTDTRFYMLAEEVAQILHCDPQTIRTQAHRDPSKLGFPVCVMGARVRIPRKAFWAAMGGDKSSPAEQEVSR